MHRLCAAGFGFLGVWAYSLDIILPELALVRSYPGPDLIGVLGDFAQVRTLGRSSLVDWHTLNLKRTSIQHLRYAVAEVLGYWFV